MSVTASWAPVGTLSADGKSLEYACVGPSPREAPTLVLLHEGLGCVALWRDFPVALAEATGFGVFAYSRAGYGQSDAADLPRPLDYMTREACDVLPEVFDAIGIRRAVLLGHSDGATIAAIYAGSITDSRVHGIIMMAPHFFTEEVGLAEIARARDTFDESDDLRKRMAKYHCDPNNTFRGWSDSWLNTGFKAWNVGEVIDTIRVPVLAIQGRADQYGTLAQIDELKNRATVPVETLILDDCRHSPQFDRTVDVVLKIAEFCKRLETCSATEPDVA